ncbi:hypothetical protein [Photobacterium leiognathi]|uniref:hypothetical protein n=1 Tax=Photobacterium leiognathi TaxID=553611 RepID=UPI002981A861|nr:hypothetical protein [Photobacterium leiognathi]
MANPKPKAEKENKECFIIMPIADAEGYPNGHFKHVYDNIISPACDLAGFKPVRADEVKQTNLIHLDILKQLIEAPIAICDLSNRNPNVLFELGIRQAFDKPVVLIQEKGTPKIFDIAPLRYLEYCKEMKYHDVLFIQKELKDSIEATFEANGKQGNVNSIVKLLALNSPAQLPDIEHNRELLSLDVMHAEMRQMKSLVESMALRGVSSKSSIELIEYERISNEITSIVNNKRMSEGEREERLKYLLMEAEEFMMRSNSQEYHRHYRGLMERAHRALSSGLRTQAN